MNRYNISEALDFLECEMEMTPAEMKSEVEDAMCEVETDSPLWHTLLCVADLLEKIEEVA